MKSFVVGYIDWSNNELFLERIEATDWREAWAKHTKSAWYNYPDETDPISDNLEDAKQSCFDMDCMMNHIEIT